MDESPNTHDEEQQGGWFTREEIVHLAVSGKINYTEMALLSMIDWLASGEDGCFAKDSYLAKKIGKSTDWIGRILSKFRAMGLVIQESANGKRRNLRTRWSDDRRKLRCVIGENSDDRRKLLGENSDRQPEKTPMIGEKSGKKIQMTGENSDRQPEKTPIGNRRKLRSATGENSDDHRSTLKGTTLRVTNMSNQRSNQSECLGTHSCAHANEGLFGHDVFCTNGAKQLMTILEKNQSDLLAPPKRPRLSSFAKNFKILILDRQVSKERIKKVVKWLRVHYEDQFTPKMYKIDDFARNFKRYEEAMKRWQVQEGETPSGNEEREILIRKMFRLIDEKEIAWPLVQKDIDECLKELGEPAGSITRDDL